jgi:arginase
MHCTILGAPVQVGSGRMGCEMGPSALRTAGLAGALTELGHTLTDLGTVTLPPVRSVSHANAALKALPEIVAWTDAIAQASYEASADAMPIFLGGVLAISAGTVTGLSRRAAEIGRPLFVLWLDAHPDFHTLDTTTSGNLHGVPLAYASGQKGFSG